VLTGRNLIGGGDKMKPQAYGQETVENLAGEELGKDQMNRAEVRPLKTRVEETLCASAESEKNRGVQEPG
jgi:hypothetical protein